MTLTGTNALLTRRPIIRHIEELPAGSLFYYPELGDGSLCIAASYGGQTGHSTMIVPLSGKEISPYALQTLPVNHLSGRAALVEGAKAFVDLATATNFDEAAVHVGDDGIYVRLRSERPGMITRQCLRLDDGVIRSSPPSLSLGFARWRIAMDDDPSEELWDSDILNRQDIQVARNGG